MDLIETRPTFVTFYIYVHRAFQNTNTYHIYLICGYLGQRSSRYVHPGHVLPQRWHMMEPQLQPWVKQRKLFLFYFEWNNFTNTDFGSWKPKPWWDKKRGSSIKSIWYMIHVYYVYVTSYYIIIKVEHTVLHFGSKKTDKIWIFIEDTYQEIQFFEPKWGPTYWWGMSVAVG